MHTALRPTAAAALALACPAFAGLNKCVDADGNVTYRQTACPGSDTAQEIATAVRSAQRLRQVGAQPLQQAPMTLPCKGSDGSQKPILGQHR